MDEPNGNERVVETPEGARLTLVVAGPVVRALAWGVDVALRAVILVAVYVAFSSALNDLDTIEAVFGLALLVMFVLSWLYTTLFELYAGATPGKRLFGLAVVHDNATPVTAGGALVRNLLRAVDTLPMFYLVGLVTLMLDGRFRRLGDLAAGTLVVHAPRGRRARGAFGKRSPTLSDVVPVAPPVGLDADGRQAIVSFADRAASLSAERRLELCRALAPLMPEGADQVRQVLGWALAIRGEHESDAAHEPGARR